MSDEQQPIGAGRIKPGSVSAAIMGYYGSIEFQGLAKSTRDTYRNMLDRFRAKHGDGPIAGMQTKHVNAIIDDMASTPSSASNFRKRLSAIMDYAMSAGMRSDNPVRDAKRVKLRTAGHRTWSEDDIAAFRSHWGEGTPQRLAMEILLYTGLRRSDAVRIGWRHVYDNRILITAQKTGADLDIPIHVGLATFLQSCPRTDPTFIITSFGQPRSEKAFSAYISEAAKDAGLPAKSAPHGLRKAACRRLAEAGCSAMEIMSITAHTDIREIERYCREAGKRGLSLSAMAKVEKGFDVKLPNPADGLGEDDDKPLNLLGAIANWRSRQDSNLRPSA